MERICPRCSATNPPQYKFCGQCGVGLTDLGTITLAKSGLITRMNRKAWQMLGYQENEMMGKPFTLFIARPDMVIFFSHLNDLKQTAGKQIFEITLKHKLHNNIYMLLEFRADGPPGDPVYAIQITFVDIIDNRLATVQMQSQQELLSLIFTVTHQINTVGIKHIGDSIEDALKKICLFTRADNCFFYTINRPLKRLEPTYGWQQSPSSGQKKRARVKSIPVSKIKNTLLRLRQEKSLVVHDMARMASPERDEVAAWLTIDRGALICHIAYCGKMPVAVIGVTKQVPNNGWTPDCVSLIKFFGDLIANRIPTNVHLFQPDTAAPQAAEKKPTGKSAQKVIDLNGKRRRPVEAEQGKSADKSGESKAVRKLLPNMNRSMLLEKLNGDQSLEKQQVFLRDDGLVLVTCPHCGIQESFLAGQFEKRGNSIKVGCPCGAPFAAVLEKRRHFRKTVRLEGYFSVSGDLGPVTDNGSIWGPMLVKDLSKAGLRFTSDKAHLVHPGDQLMVRFNLDNKNQALIHKPVRVINVSDHGVGCRFEGADSYDITLGFYFM